MQSQDLERARQALEMASSLDPDMTAPLYHRAEMAAVRRDTNRLSRLVTVTQFGAISLATDVGFSLDRYVNDPKNCSFVVDQSDVDRELAISIHKFLGPIQRIDEPVALPRRALGERWQADFFGNNRNIGC